MSECPKCYQSREVYLIEDTTIVWRDIMVVKEKPFSNYTEISALCHRSLLKLEMAYVF